ncbi:hypothetical protein SAMN02745116_01410 [Pilibacter termitis]|uniref:Uncharacterized protein n=1 Tax=Pilibacter termitis TaxID=263852 RepID=A0A1T4NFB0_9ENTE|nr:hypothetical protein [Pilibacter termitis]SJZ77805.1 hypothetical protein SAMN02745116_01410 [Pilibacter termitis]
MTDGSGILGILSGFIFAVIIACGTFYIIKEWKNSNWLKIGSVLIVFLILADFTTNKGQATRDLLAKVINTISGGTFK